jgi:hypothetical protein
MSLAKSLASEILADRIVRFFIVAGFLRENGSLLFLVSQDAPPPQLSWKLLELSLCLLPGGFSCGSFSP